MKTMNQQLIEALSALVNHVNCWCEALEKKGSDWDNWDEFYKDCRYYDRKRDVSLKKLNALIRKAKKKEKEDNIETIHCICGYVYMTRIPYSSACPYCNRENLHPTPHKNPNVSNTPKG